MIISTHIHDNITLIIGLCWLVFISYWAISAPFTKKDIRSRSSWQRYLIVRIILAILIVAIIRLGILNSSSDVNSVSNINSIGLEYLGLILTALGIGLAIWARVHLGSNWSGRPSLKEGHELVTSGPYRFIRHPIYTGILMAMLGVVAAISIWGLVPFILFCLIFIRRVGIEERIMLKLFPQQYPDYQRHTKKLIPYVW